MGISFSSITKPFKKAAEVVTKPFAKITNKLLPNELRFLAPYAAGIGTLMLPPGMGPLMRTLSAAGLNTAGQIAADESATGEIDDINKFSLALAGGLGALGSDTITQGADGTTSGIRGGINAPQKEAIMEQLKSTPIGTSEIPSDFVMPKTSFLQGVELSLIHISEPTRRS